MIEENVGETRRSVMKKAAVVGAVAWSAPMVLSSPAFASTGRCSGSVVCTTFYGNSITTSNGGAPYTVGSVGIGQCATRSISALLCPGVTYNPVPTLQTGTGVNAVTTSGDSGTYFSITFPAGAVPIGMDIHFGGAPCTSFNFDEPTNQFVVNGVNQCLPTVVTSGTISGGITVTITKNSNVTGCGFSGTNVYFCK